MTPAPSEVGRPRETLVIRRVRVRVSDAVMARKKEEEAAAATAAVEVSTPRAPSDASTVKSEPAPPPPSDGEAEAAELRAAVAAASTAEPLPPAGEAAKTWDGGETFHWSSRPKGADGALLKIDAASERFKVEKRAFAAIVALDKAAHRMHTRPKCSASYRAVRVGWLKSFAATLDRAWATFEVVAKKVQPETAATRCRFVELLAAGDVGEADLFASHTWGALFVDLVAAIAHVATDDMYVWIDIFAVRQWPGNVGDLDFRPVVGEARAFLLSARHIDEVAQMEDADVFAHKVPEVAKRVCAFCRVWCVVELGSAVAFEKPVVMLVGAASADGSSFEPNGAMLPNLYLMTDVRKAVASVEADRVRELANVEAQEGGADAVNSLARGACLGAGSCMHRRDILAAAVGNLAALDELESKEAREDASEELLHLIEDSVKLRMISDVPLGAGAAVQPCAPHCEDGPQHDVAVFCASGVFSIQPCSSSMVRLLLAALLMLSGQHVVTGLVASRRSGTGAAPCSGKVNGRCRKAEERCEDGLLRISYLGCPPRSSSRGSLSTATTRVLAASTIRSVGTAISPRRAAVQTTRRV